MSGANSKFAIPKTDTQYSPARVARAARGRCCHSCFGHEASEATAHRTLKHNRSRQGLLCPSWAVLVLQNRLARGARAARVTDHHNFLYRQGSAITISDRYSTSLATSTDASAIIIRNIILVDVTVRERREVCESQ